MSHSDAGKGDTPRPFDRKKWDATWAKLEEHKKRTQARKPGSN